MQKMPIPSPEEGDFGKLRMEPLGSRRRDAHPGLILEPQEHLWAGASSASEGRIKIISSSSLLIEKGDTEPFVLEILLCFQHREIVYEP